MSKIFDALQREAGELSDLIVSSVNGQKPKPNGTLVAEPAIRDETLESTNERESDDALKPMAPTTAAPTFADLLAAVESSLPKSTAAEASLGSQVTVEAKNADALIESVARIKCSLTPESRVIAPNNGHLPVLERFRVLEHRLNHLRRTRPFTRILVTSAAPREGKTFVSINLAVTLASGSSRVLLVDADMRRPGINKALGLEAHAGLAEVLDGKQSLVDALRVVEPFGFYYLSAGKPDIDAGELLKTAPARERFEQMKDLFDVVIVDSCPILPFSDVHLLASMTDAVLMVARTALTNHGDLQEALAALAAHHLLGIVLNGSEDASEKSYYSRYYTRGK